jgi:DNA-binding PadR family transcriptional regulator
MTAVFSHGRLRLYLLKLLAAGPKHGYELIRLLENRFYGLYAPSAGTIYPRLSRMEADGLVTHAAVGGRKVYEITDAGRAELDRRQAELAALESEIHASVADLAAIAEEVEEGVRGSVRMLKQELRQAARDARPPRAEEWRYWRDAWRTATSPADDLGDPAPPRPGPETSADDLVRKVEELSDEVIRLIRQGRATAESVRVASTVLDSVRAQLRDLLGR